MTDSKKLNKKIIILGAGISGLSMAYVLKKRGYNPIIFESKSKTGGVIESIEEKGFIYDTGPSSLMVGDKRFFDMVDDLGLTNKLLKSSPESNKRYILRDNILHALLPNPKTIFKSKLFSFKGKISAVKDIFKTPKDNDLSMAEFASQHFGEEISNYAFDPLLSGIYAGNTEKLSLKAVFPFLYEARKEKGSIIRGMIARKKRIEKSGGSVKRHICSFTGGVQSLTNALTEYIGNSIFLNTTISSIVKKNNKYHISYNNEKGTINNEECDILISTLPSYALKDILWDSKLIDSLNNITFPKVGSLVLAYNKNNIKQNLDSFGFLVPSLEKKNFLGAIWSSVIFPNRAPNDKAIFTLYIGGAKNQKLLNLSDDRIISLIREEFEVLMGIDSSPILQNLNIIKNAIPQYNLGINDIWENILKFEKENKNIYLTGNWRDKVSVSGCIEKAFNMNI